MNTGAGRNPDLTDELIKEIKECILAGKNLKDTAIHIFNNYSNLRPEEKEKGVDNYIQKIYNWKSQNYLDIDDKIRYWGHERKLMLAERNIVEFLEMDTKNIMLKGKELVEQTDTGLVKVKADMSKFVAETLGRDSYSKRSELTGKGGGAIQTQVITDDDFQKVVTTYADTRKESGGDDTDIPKED